MKIKIIISYLLLLVVVVFSHAFPSRFVGYLLALYLVSAPFVLGHTVRFLFSLKHLLFGLITSGIILLPLYLVLSSRSPYHLLTAPAMLAQLVLVSLPEEVFFRGFLQESFGNNINGLLLASLLFAVAHMPALIFYKDAYALLTFFPSLVMGFLYLRASNILPGVVFHFLSNVVYQGFVI